MGLAWRMEIGVRVLDAKKVGVRGSSLENFQQYKVFAVGGAHDAMLSQD